MSHIADSTRDAPTLFHQPRPFKNPGQSKKCWESRNIFYGCLDKNNVERPPEYSHDHKRITHEHGTDKMVCHNDREAFEGDCARDWVTFFNRRRILECRLRDYDEKKAEAVRQDTEKAAKKPLEQHLAEGGQ